MLKDITLGQFFPGNSFIHRLDAAVKILLSMVYMVFIFLIQNYYGYLFLALFTFVVIKSSKVPFRFIIKGLKPVLFFILITAALNLFMTGTTVLWSFGFLKITLEGVHYAIFMVLRIIFLVLGTSMLTYTTSPIALTDGIEKLLSPFKRLGVPSHELAMMMTIALRFIPTLLEEADKIMKAQTARGADFETGNLLARAKALLPLLVPLFISAFRRADELATAMECRCYNGGDNRTRLYEAKPGITDVYGALLMVLFAGIIVLLNFVG